MAFPIVLIYLAIASARIFVSDCQVLNSNQPDVFNFKPLGKLPNISTNITLSDNIANEELLSQYQYLSYSFCRYQEAGTISDTVYSYGYLTDSDSKSIIPITYGNNSWADALSSFSSIRNSESGHITGAILEYAIFSDNDYSFKLIVNVLCDASDYAVSSNPNATISYNAMGNYFTINETILSTAGCPVFEITYFLQLIEQNKIVYSVVLITVGAFLGSQGIMTIKAVVLIFSVILSTGVGLTIGNKIIPVDMALNYGKYILLGFIAMGIALGAFAIAFTKFGFFIVGMIGGQFFGLTIYTLIPITFYAPNLTLFIILVVFGIAGGWAALYIAEEALIFSTAMCGSYAIGRGISGIIGGFPSEAELLYKIKNGNFESISHIEYAYMAGILVLAVASVLYQNNKRKKKSVNNLFQN